MDQDLRELERAAEAARGDTLARVRWVLALARDGRLEDAWKAARSGDAASSGAGLLRGIADALLEAAGAPFTSQGQPWPAPVGPSLEALLRRLEAILRDEATETSRAVFSPAFRELAPVLPGPMHTGSSIGGYSLEAILGRGGFAHVYRTSPRPEDGDEWAAGSLCVKIGYVGGGGGSTITRVQADVLSSRGVRADELIAQGMTHETRVEHVGTVPAGDVRSVLAAEFDLLATWRSELFPRLVRSGVEDDRAFYVMERIEGPTLREVLRERRRSPPHGELPGPADFARLLAGFVELKARYPGFFHGDLKPENIFVTARGLRVIDPAYRSAGGQGLARTLTVAYDPLGLEGERGDTLALAIVLFEAWTQVQPFAGRTLAPEALAPGEAPADHARRVLGLERLEPFVTNGEIRQLVGWMTEPPTYEAMRAGLEGFADARR